jgi:hypothetical protein
MSKIIQSKVTALYQSYLAVQTLAVELKRVEVDKEDHPPSAIVEQAAYDLLPAILAVQAENVGEGFIQLCALTRWMWTQSELTNDVTCYPALVSIMRGMAKGLKLPDGFVLDGGI